MYNKLKKKSSCANVYAHKLLQKYSQSVSPYMAEKGLSWKQCVDICTDGARSMVGKTRVFLHVFKAIVLELCNRKCIIDGQAISCCEKRFQTT
jgi:hypothetical protein